MNLPLFRLVINDDDHTGVTAVALVDEPAIQINWQAFDAKKPHKFETVSVEKRIIAGPLMIPNTPIYRRDDQRGEYNVVFFSEDIDKIVDKYHKNQYEKNVNPMHESMLLLPDIYMVSDFQIDPAFGIMTPKGWDPMPDRSWFGMFKVRNDEIWNEYIKTGIFKGFSVEGYFNEIPVEDFTDAEISLIQQILS